MFKLYYYKNKALSALVEKVKNIAAYLFYPFVPHNIKERVVANYFQPHLDKGILEKSYRRYLNIHYYALSD